MTKSLVVAVVPAFTVVTLTPFFCHWYDKLLPVAVTLNAKGSLAQMVVFAMGCDVNIGFGFTVMPCGVLVWLGTQAPVTTQV